MMAKRRREGHLGEVDGQRNLCLPCFFQDGLERLKGTNLKTSNHPKDNIIVGIERNAEVTDGLPEKSIPTT